MALGWTAFSLWIFMAFDTVSHLRRLSGSDLEIKKGFIFFNDFVELKIIFAFFSPGPIRFGHLRDLP